MSKFEAIDQAVPFVVIERGRNDSDEQVVDWAVCLNEKAPGADGFEAAAEDYHGDILDALTAAQALSNAKGYPLVLNDDAVAAIMERLQELRQIREESLELGGGIMSKVPVISTGHLTYGTTRWLEELDDRNTWSYFASYRDGHMIQIPLARDLLDEARMTDSQLPDDLKALFVWAREQDVDWVRLDMDGAQVDDLPFYDWDVELRARKNQASPSPEM